jgi:uncharacterized membrane protein
MIVTILLCVCLVITGALLPRPAGWVVVGLAVLALLMALGAPHLRI